MTYRTVRVPFVLETELVCHVAVVCSAIIHGLLQPRSFPTTISYNYFLQSYSGSNPSVQHKYKITGQTKSSPSGAATNGKIYYTITGTKGKTSEFLTPISRQLGKMHTTSFSDSTDIGDFRCVNVRSTSSDGWLFSEVVFHKQKL